MELSKWATVICMVCDCRQRYYYLEVLPEGWRIPQLSNSGLLCGSCWEKFGSIYRNDEVYLLLNRLGW